MGQFQSNGALTTAKESGESPRQIAEKIAGSLKDNPIFSQVEVAGPGFINLTLQDKYLAEQTNRLLQDDRVGIDLLKPQKVIIDFGGPNVAKPLHVGHLRSSIIGDSLQRLYRFLGHEVYGDIHLGDWGTPMGLLIAAIKEEQPELPYFNPDYTVKFPADSPVSIDDLEVLYPQAAARAKEDEEFRKKALEATAQLQAGHPGYTALWKHFVEVSIAALKENFDNLGVTFDWWYGESHYHHRIAPLLEKLQEQGFAKYSEGALIIPLENQTTQETPPLLLTKSDGAYLYSTTDLAAIEERVREDRAEIILYVVDQRQSLHFKQVFAAAYKTGVAPQEVVLRHLGFGTMNGPDGKPFKTRAGGVMKLKDLINLTEEKSLERMQEAGLGNQYPEEERREIAQKVGKAALKFADLINNRTSDYLFDPDRFASFEGKTGPYLVYTAVRIKSIFRKLELDPEKNFAGKITPPGDQERNLMLTLNLLTEAINEAYQQNAPHHLGEFAFKLGQEFNAFYQKCRILTEKDEVKRNSWIALARLSYLELKLVLNILGIEIPERM